MNPVRPPIREEPSSTICLANLWQWGYFGDPEEVAWAEIDSQGDSSRIESGIAKYQEFFGDELRIDGELGDATSTHIMQPRCSVPDFSRADASLSQWPRSCMGDITTSHRISLRGLTDQQVHAVWLDCLRLANLTSGIHLTFQRDMSTARIYADDGSTERNVLAWSYMPQNACGQRLQQRYGTRWTWSQAKFREVALHELGHALGLPHDNSRQSIMYPSAITGFQAYQPRDIAQLQRRYGPNTDEDDDDPNPPSPPGERIIHCRWTMDGRHFEVAEIPSGPGNSWGA